MTLADTELYDVAERFGVDLGQVRRDHAISHLLASISQQAPETFLFVGGTMLSRTWLPDLRLSEDVDLMVYEPRAQAGALLAEAAKTDIAPVFGPVEWDVDPHTAGDAQSIYLSTGDVTIKIQLVDTDGRPSWPHDVRDIEQRHSDARPARLKVPTASAGGKGLAPWSSQSDGDGADEVRRASCLLSRRRAAAHARGEPDRVRQHLDRRTWPTWV